MGFTPHILRGGATHESRYRKERGIESIISYARDQQATKDRGHGGASIAGIGFGHLLKGRGYKANDDYGVE